MRYTVVVTSNNTFWYKENTEEDIEGEEILHRVGGPAVEFANGDKCWYQDDQRHRLDGPAIEFADGRKEWFLEDKSYTEAEFLKKTQPAACEGMTVEVGGIKYQLKAC